MKNKSKLFTLGILLCVMFQAGIAQTYTLTVVNSGTGTGSVISSPAGISCGATCSATFAAGTTVTLVATAGASSSFVGWSGGGSSYADFILTLSGCTGPVTCPIVMNSDLTVYAVFNCVAPTLGTYPNTTVISGQNTTITPSVAPSYAASIFATADNNFSGILTVNPVTGVISVTDAKQAGSYTVTVKATNGTCVTTASFVLTVSNPNCSQALFNTASLVSTGEHGTAVSIGDFNNDGKQDIVTTNYGGNGISIKLGDGTGGFSGGSNLLPGHTMVNLAIVDINGDGNQDLLIADYSASTAAIQLGDGAGGYTSGGNVSVGANPFSIVTGDFNGDGNLDFATANYGSSTVSVRLGNGAGGFSGTTELGAGIYPLSVVTGDFNQDGFLDLAAANSFSNNDYIYMGNGTGSFSAGIPLAMGAYPLSIAIGDFNQDGKLDLATANANSNNVYINLNNGAGGFGSPIIVNVGGIPNSVAIGDFNGDGKQDIATPNYSTNDISIRLGDGTGGFSGTTQVGVGTTDPSYLAIGDFNSDGFQDLVTENYTNDNVSILLGGKNSIKVQGNSNNISNGSVTPSLTNSTDFGSVCRNGSSITETYTIQNTGTTSLQLNSGAVTVAGADASLFTIGGITLPVSLAGGNSITFTVTFVPSSAGVKNATIHIANNSCDNSDYNFAVTALVNEIPVGSATSNTICSGNSADILLSSTVAGTSFAWVSSNTAGTVVGYNDCSTGCGTTISDILSNLAGSGGIVQYVVTPTSPAGCIGTPFNVTSTVATIPTAPVLSGPFAVCGLLSVTYTATSSYATSYTWTTPTGINIISGAGTSAINCNTIGFTNPGILTCTASNGCGNSTAVSQQLAKKPIPATSINGPYTVCSLTSATYSVTPCFGATSYNWTLPAGMTITSGAGTTQINVSIVASSVLGNMRCDAVNACGYVAGPLLFITGHVPSVPGILSGPTNVCGLTTATYSIPAVANATGYTWTIPTWMNITSGLGTRTITVTATGTPAAGTISVAATNACGSGAARSITLTTSSLLPGAITGPATLCGATSATYTIASLGAGYTYNWSLAITGWTITTGAGTTSITISGPATGNSTTGLVKVSSTNTCGNTGGIRTLVVNYCRIPMADNPVVAGADNTVFSVLYPNPTSSEFKQDVTTDVNQEMIVQVYDVLGNLIISEKHEVATGTSTLTTNLANYKAGLYFVRLVDSNASTVYSQTVVKQ